MVFWEALQPQTAKSEFKCEGEDWREQMLRMTVNCEDELLINVANVK